MFTNATSKSLMIIRPSLNYNAFFFRFFFRFTTLECKYMPTLLKTSCLPLNGIIRVMSVMSCSSFSNWDLKDISVTFQPRSNRFEIPSKKLVFTINITMKSKNQNLIHIWQTTSHLQGFCFCGFGVLHFFKASKEFKRPYIKIHYAFLRPILLLG